MKSTTALRKRSDLEIVTAILKKEKVTKDDQNSLTPKQRELFNDICNKKQLELKGADFDKLMYQLDDIINEAGRHAVWENDHQKILVAIHQLINQDGRMPSRGLISMKSGLSRPTINKHLKEYKDHPVFHDITEQFKLMSTKVLSTVFHHAVNGDMKACKIYLDMFGCPGHEKIKAQTNYIQINGFTITQDQIQELPAGQLNRLQSLLQSKSKIKLKIK